MFAAFLGICSGLALSRSPKFRITYIKTLLVLDLKIFLKTHFVHATTTFMCCDKKRQLCFCFLKNPARDDRMAQQVKMHAAKLDQPEFDPWNSCG